VPVKSQSTTNPASASISESAPKPIKAIELAAIPAPMAIANSTKWYAIPPQASSRARRSSRARSGERRRRGLTVIVWMTGSGLEEPAP